MADKRSVSGPTSAPKGLSKGLGKGSKKKSSKKGGKKLHHMHIEPSDNDGFVVHHSFGAPEEGESPTPDETHAIGNPDDLLSHVQQHFGGQLPPPAAAGGGAGGPGPGGM